MNGLTVKQKAVYDFVVQSIRTNQRPPSFQEIGAKFGITPNAVNSHLKALKRKGFIKNDGGKDRGIELLKTKPWKRYLEIRGVLNTAEL